MNLSDKIENVKVIYHALTKRIGSGEDKMDKYIKKALQYNIKYHTNLYNKATTDFNKYHHKKMILKNTRLLNKDRSLPDNKRSIELLLSNYINYLYKNQDKNYNIIKHLHKFY